MSHGFLIEEYKSLRAEIAASQQARRDYEIYGAGAIAALYAWLAGADGNAVNLLNAVAWWVAPALAAGVAVRTSSLSEGIRKAGGYLKQTEAEVLTDGPPLGWHVTLGLARAARDSANQSRKGESSEARSAAAVDELVAKQIDRGFAERLIGDIDRQKDLTVLTWRIVALVTALIAVGATLMKLTTS